MTRAATIALTLLVGCVGAAPPVEPEHVETLSGGSTRAAADPGGAPARSTIAPPPPSVAAPIAVPAPRAALSSLRPGTTRAGHLRFATDEIHDPVAAQVFLERLARRDEPEDVRAALAEALPRTGGDFGDALAPLLASEPSPLVRAALVGAAARAPAPVAHPVIRRGLADADREVRLQAARAAAAHPEGAALAATLRASLASDDAALRAELARALGVHRVIAARDELVALLGDRSPDVRLAALRAVERSAPGSLRGSPELEQLSTDPDGRVSRAAAALLKR